VAYGAAYNAVDNLWQTVNSYVFWFIAFCAFVGTVMAWRNDWGKSEKVPCPSLALPSPP